MDPMSTSSPYTVIVGVDGSESSRHALQWGIWHAGIAGGRVVAIQAWELHSMYHLEEIAEQIKDAAAKSLRETIRSVGIDLDDVEHHVVEGYPVEVLLAQSGQAQLLVIGNRGRGGFAGALLGSVSQHCVHHARCPVVMVREGASA
jgi:nucleotide-binding universal stress UspA family protein